MNDSTALVAPLPLRPAIAYTLSPATAAARCSRGRFKLGPGNHPTPGVKISVLVSTLLFSSTPPTATSLPAEAAGAGAPRRGGQPGPRAPPPSPRPRADNSVVRVDSPT